MKNHKKNSHGNNDIIQLHLSFKNLNDDKTIVFLDDDKGTFIIRICDSNIVDYYPSLSKKSMTTLEFINHHVKKRLNLYIPNKFNKIQFSNISSENIQVKHLSLDKSSNTFVIGKNIRPLKHDEIIIGRGDYENLYNFQMNDQGQFIEYELNRYSLEFTKKKRSNVNNIDQILAYYSFDTFEEFMVIMNLIKNKFGSSNVHICNYNNVELDSFNYIEVHLVECTYPDVIDKSIEIRLGYKERW